MRRAGRHFLQIPGPTNVPDRVLRAMDMPTMDHRSPEMGELGRKVLEGMKTIFRCSGPVVIYPASGTGAWEAALVNTLSPGDQVLIYESGHFAALWKAMATRLGLEAEAMQGGWRAPDACRHAGGCRDGLGARRCPSSKRWRAGGAGFPGVTPACDRRFQSQGRGRCPIERPLRRAQ